MGRKLAGSFGKQYGRIDALRTGLACLASKIFQAVHGQDDLFQALYGAVQSASCPADAFELTADGVLDGAHSGG